MLSLRLQAARERFLNPFAARPSNLGRLAELPSAKNIL